MVAKTIQKCSDENLKYVRSSNLHFSIQETPFSINIAVRKKFIDGSPKIKAEEPNALIEKLSAELSMMNENLIQYNRDLENFQYLPSGQILPNLTNK